MFPNFLKIGSFTIHTYGLLVAIGLLFGFRIVIHWAKKYNLPEEKVQDLLFYVVITGFLSARLFYVFINWSEYRIDILRVLRIWEGGLVFYGGLFGGIIATLFLAKKFSLDLWRLGDILVVGLSLGQFFGRLGCFSAGCCYGRPAPSNLGITFTNPDSLAIIGIPLYPTQLIEAFLVLGLFLVLSYSLRKVSIPGITFSFYLIGYGLIRFIVEFYRGDNYFRYFWGLSLAQIISLGAIAFGGLLLNYFLLCSNESKGG